MPKRLRYLRRRYFPGPLSGVEGRRACALKNLLVRRKHDGRGAHVGPGGFEELVIFGISDDDTEGANDAKLALRTQIVECDLKIPLVFPSLGVAELDIYAEGLATRCGDGTTEYYCDETRMCQYTLTIARE